MFSNNPQSYEEPDWFINFSIGKTLLGIDAVFRTYQLFEKKNRQFSPTTSH